MRYKARMVVKEFQQREGVEFNQIFSPVVKLTTIKSVMSIVVVEDLHLEQLDVKIVFFRNDLKDINMMQPQAYITQGKELLVCKLKKSLYGFKKAPRQWYLKFNKFMITFAIPNGLRISTLYY